MSTAGTVHIIALGARTPVGLTAESTAASVRAGIRRISEHPFVTDGAGVPVGFARDPRIEPGVSGWRRLVRLATAALIEVLEKLNHAMSLPGRVPILLALPETRPGFQGADAAAVVREVMSQSARDGFTAPVEPSTSGHAGGLQALASAVKSIAQRREDLVIVGGVDSYFDPETLGWLAQHRQLSGDTVRSGMIPGEAAGFVALASEGARRRLGLPSLGTVRGTGTAVETKLIKTDDVNLGEGLATALRQAVQGLVLPREAVDAIYCDINGERYRSEEWGFAVLREQAALRESGYVAPANCWGDVGAASGPLCVNLAVQSWSRRYAPGPVALVWAGSERGLRAAVVVDEPKGG